MNDNDIIKMMQQNIGFSGLRKLGYRAGIKRIADGYYAGVLVTMKKVLDNVVGKSVTLMQHGHRKTVTVQDIKYAAKQNGTPLYI